VANVTLEKSNKPPSLEEREEKIRQIIKWKFIVKELALKRIQMLFQ
jgi:hypothetical protein